MLPITSRISLTLLLSCMLLTTSTLQAQPKLTHVVQAGQTLYAIARQYGVNVADVQALNASVGPTLQVGQKVRIPALHHTIAPHETIYSIAQQYGVSVATITQCNPGVQAGQLQVGGQLLLPELPIHNTTRVDNAKKTKAGGRTSLPTPPPGTPQQSLANSPCREMHRVAKKETVYSIAKQYDVSVEALLRMNPEIPIPSYKLKRGDLLCIPFATTTAATTGTKDIHTTTPKPRDQREQANTTTPTNQLKKNKVRMALLMPFLSKGSIGEKSIAFYRGALLAVDAWRKQGLSVDIIAENAVGSTAVTQALKNPLLSQCDMIFAPFDRGDIAQITAYGQAHKILTVVPFSSQVSSVYTNPYVLLLNAPEAIRNEEAAKQLVAYFKHKAFVFLNTPNGNEQHFVQTLQAQLKAAKISYTNLALTDNTERTQKAIRQLGNCVIMTNASDAKTLSAFAEKMTVLKARYATPCQVVGYPEWQLYADKYFAQYKAWDTYLFSPFYCDPNAPTTRRFEQQYQKAFGVMPLRTSPSMAMTGYDATYHMLALLQRYGLDLPDNEGYMMQAAAHQNQFKLQRIPAGGMVNTHVGLVHYAH